MNKNQSINQRNYRLRNQDNLKCSYCGKKLSDEDGLRIACNECRRRHNARTIYRRWFNSLFMGKLTYDDSGNLQKM